MNGMQMHSTQQDPFGWAIIIAGAILTLWVVAAAIYWTVCPGENEANHPKRSILKDDR